MGDSGRRLEFIEVSTEHANGTNSVGTSADAQRKVRSMAMRHYRARTREKRGEDEPHEDAAASGSDAWAKHRAGRKEARRAAQGLDTGLTQSRSPISGPASRPLDRATTPLQLASSTGLSGLRQVNPQAFLRIALVDVFAHHYYPPGSEAISSLPQILSEWTAIRSPAMQVGSDALMLLHLGSLKSDRRIILEGQRRYLATIRYLQSELNNPNSDFDGMLSAAHDLLCAEIYRAVTPSENAWASHSPGLTAIAAACSKQPGPNCLRCFLFWQLRHVNLMHSLVSRKPASRGYHDWFLGAKDASAGSIELLVRITLRLPGLLCQIDTLDHREDSQQEAATRIGEAVDDIAQASQSWFAAFCMANGLENNVSGSNESHAVPFDKLGDVSTPSPAFPSFLIASCVIFHWCCMLVLEQTRFELASYIRPESQDRYRAAADQYVQSIWSSLPYLEREAGGPVCRAASVNGALHFMFSWFDRSGNLAQLRRVRQLQKTIRDEMPFLQWNALLPYSFLGLLWLS